MTPEAAIRIRESFKLLAPQLEPLTRDVYARLFSARPDIQPLFRKDMRTQEQHLGAALALVVRNLSVIEALEGSFQQLGADHARIGVRPEHYPPVRDAMLASMSSALSAADAWTAELAEDWRCLFDQIATFMLQGRLSAASASNA